MDSERDLTSLSIGAISAQYCERFTSGVDSVWPSDSRLGLAVSGGTDSMAMLLLAHRTQARAFEVATVDHGLRPEAAEECQLVARVCELLDIPCAILSVSINAGNVQAEARKARYDALGQWALERGLGSVATAHHADDQAETIMMRLNRGSGLAGMAGIRQTTRIDDCAVPIVRPLLSFRRDDLRAIVKQAGAPWVEDPSNSDPAYDRVRMRQALAHADWVDPVAVSQTAAFLAEAEATLQSLADQHWQDHAIVSASEVRVPHTCWTDTNARLVTRAIRQFGGAPGRADVDALLHKMVEIKSRANLAGALITREEAEYVITTEPPRRAG